MVRKMFIPIATVFCICAFCLCGCASKDKLVTQSDLIDNTYTEYVTGNDVNSQTETQKDREIEKTEYSIIYRDEGQFDLNPMGFVKPGQVLFDSDLEAKMSEPRTGEKVLYAVNIVFYEEISLTDELSSEAVSHEEAQKIGEEWLRNQGIDFSFFTIAWTTEDDPDRNRINDWIVRKAYLTEEELHQLQAPENVGVKLLLISKWMDTGEDVVFTGSRPHPGQAD